MPTILLADDSITIQKIVNLTFAGEGIEVVTVGNGDAAVKKIHELRPALVLADIFMPGRNGYEVCEYVKNDPTLNATPVILLVGAFEPFDSNEAARVKADGHLTKPFEIKVLISAVNSLINAADAQEVAAPAADARVEQAGDSAEHEPEESSFAPLPEMPAAPRFIDPEEPLDVPYRAPVPVEVFAPVPLGVDTHEAEQLAHDATEPIDEAAGVDANVASVPVATRVPAPALLIEDLDPLGLLAADGGLGIGEEREIALDARSMVVDIWEPRAVIETPVSAAAEPPAVVLAEETEPSAAEATVEEVELTEAEIPEVRMEAAPVEIPVISQPAAAEIEPPMPILAGPVSAAALISEELIERVANRVVEKLSREVIERIAWEVVPDLAELMIKEHVEAQLKASHPR
jgi:CheY-like chemotaxis protein